jgi:hypothetical protein
VQMFNFWFHRLYSSWNKCYVRRSKSNITQILKNGIT